MFVGYMITQNVVDFYIRRVVGIKRETGVYETDERDENYKEKRTGSRIR